MASKKGTEVATVEDAGAIVMAEGNELPDYIKAGQARGSEDVAQEDLIIPRLELIQGLSGYVKEGDPKFNPEARAGMLVNSVSGQIYGKEVMVVPVLFQKQWLVWRKRKWLDANGKEQNGEGGFFGAFNTPEEAEKRKAEAMAEGVPEIQIEIIDTPQHLCLLFNQSRGSIDEIILSMPRTKAKISRQWNSIVRMAGGDRFSRAYRITSALEKKQSGDYYNFVVAQSGFPNKSLYERAEKLYEQIKAGERRVVMDVEGEEVSDDHSNTEM